jgi:hypothetical protein
MRVRVSPVVEKVGRHAQDREASEGGILCGITGTQELYTRDNKGCEKALKAPGGNAKKHVCLCRIDRF